MKGRATVSNLVLAARKMPKTTPRASLREEFELRGEAILETALAEFCENGYNATSISSIASRLGVSDGLLYKHLDGKEELLYRSIAWHYAEVVQKIRDEVKKEKAPLDRMRRFVELQFLSWRDSPKFNLLYFHETRRPPHKYSSILIPLSSSYVRCFEDILRDGIESGQFQPDLNVRFIRDFVIGGLDHSVWWAAATGRRIDVEALTEQSMAYVLPGLLAKPAAKGASAKKAAKKVAAQTGNRPCVGTS